MSQVDRLRVQVPVALPDWMDGPAIRERARKWRMTYEQAKKRMIWRSKQPRRRRKR